MRFLLHLLATVAWALWFGATIATFVFALHLFHTHPDIAGEANSAMFVVFGTYELILAGVAIAAAGMLLVSYPSKPVVILIAWLVFTGAIGMFSALGLTPRMEILRTQNKQHTDEFKRLHGRSMIAMTAQSGMLLICGAALIVTIGNRDKAPATISEDAVTPAEKV
ncbi:MAG TPA: DUF4149 domain-containing protein [Tepidisphaeraceae bacterium]|nr:DUF4149 domain-containing protein [Tepidisphaeraceae bacterium]